MTNVQHILKSKVSTALFLGCALLSLSARADMPYEVAVIKAANLYGALTGGLPLLPTNPIRDQVISRIKEGNFLGAAALVTNEDAFYNNVVSALPQTFNVDGTAVGSKNEMSAQFLVVARDNRPVSDLVMADFTAHVPNGTSSADKYAVDDTLCRLDDDDFPGQNKYCNTRHFEAVWANANPRRELVVIGHPEFPGVGVYTSYPWAREYTFAGTARRNIRGTVENLLCSSMDAFRMIGAPDTDTAQDIPRDDVAYSTDCRTCHDRMDKIRKVFLQLALLKVNPDANAGLSLKWITPSYEKFDRINEIKGPNYPATNTKFDFFFPENDTLFQPDESKLPVQTYAGTGVKYVSGDGLRDFGNIMANSRGFYRCLVKRVVAQIYMGKQFSFSIFTPQDYEILAQQSASIEAFTTHLMATKDLGDIYRRVAVWYRVED